MIVVNDGLESERVLFDGNEGSWEVILERGQKLICEGGVFWLEMSSVLLLLVLDGRWWFEEICERVEEFGLLGGFEIAESIGDLILPEGLDGLGFFWCFQLVPDIPILLRGDVLVESFGLEEFRHQQQ